MESSLCSEANQNQMQGDGPDELDPGEHLRHPLLHLWGPQLNCFHDRGKDAHQTNEIEK